jgi:hypothetical protein
VFTGLRKCGARAYRRPSGKHLKITRGFSLGLSTEAAGKLTYADDEVRDGVE